jgi:hypothetical protein
LCDIGPPRNRIASQQALPILYAINRELRDLLTTSSYDNVANAQFALSNLNWGNAFNVRTTNAIGMHRFDVDCDGAAFGWLQRTDRGDRRGKARRA